MIFHYAGKYNGDESSLPYKEHHPNATPFKEPEDTKKLSLIANVGCILIMGILAIPFLILGIEYIPDNAIWMMIGGICGGLSLLPHELLHAICYKKDVYMYNDLAHMLMFVVGTEDMSKGRFIFMCLCPNLILGVIPYILFLIFPLVEKKKIVPYFLIVLLVSTMHKSALIFLILYFILDKKPWKIVTKGMIAISLFLLVTYPVTGPYISQVLEDSSYSQYSDMVLSLIHI